MTHLENAQDVVDIVSVWHSDVLDILHNYRDAAKTAETHMAFTNAIEAVKGFPITTQFFINEEVMVNTEEVDQESIAVQLASVVLS